MWTVNNVEHINRGLVRAGQGRRSYHQCSCGGNWGNGWGGAADAGFSCHLTIALPHKDPRVNTFFNRQREAFGSIVISTTIAVRRCMEHLRKNRLVAILVERDFGHHRVIDGFFR